MQYRKLETGMQVLWSPERTSSRDFFLGKCKLARVTELDVRHHWYAQGGYSGGGGPRETVQGVRVQVEGHEGTEVTLAAHLVELTEEKRSAWETIRARIEERNREREEVKTRVTALADRLKEYGYESATPWKETIILSFADALTIAEVLESHLGS